MPHSRFHYAFPFCFGEVGITSDVLKDITQLIDAELIDDVKRRTRHKWSGQIFLDDFKIISVFTGIDLASATKNYTTPMSRSSTLSFLARAAKAVFCCDAMAFKALALSLI